MSYKLVRVEYKSSVEWYDVDIELSEEDINQIEELYSGDVGSFLDNNERIDEEKPWGGEVIRKEDGGESFEWIIEESV